MQNKIIDNSSDTENSEIKENKELFSERDLSEKTADVSTVESQDEEQDRGQSDSEDVTEGSGKESTAILSANYFSRFLSLLFHPFVIPTYVVLLLFFGGTVISFTPLRLKVFFLVTVLLNTFFIPFLFTTLMRGARYRELMSEQYKRVLPLAVMTICFAIAAYIVPDKFLVVIVKNYLMAITVCALLAAIVSWFWKISIHMIVMGSMVAMLFMVENLGLGEVFWIMMVFLLLSGFIGSARLYLGENNLSQVIVGFLSGLVVTMCVLMGTL